MRERERERERDVSRVSIREEERPLLGGDGLARRLV